MCFFRHSNTVAPPIFRTQCEHRSIYYPANNIEWFEMTIQPALRNKQLANKPASLLSVVTYFHFFFCNCATKPHFNVPTKNKGNWLRKKKEPTQNRDGIIFQLLNSHRREENLDDKCCKRSAWHGPCRPVKYILRCAQLGERANVKQRYQ